MLTYDTELTSNSADVALLAEGTYPFMPGGVSSWIHDIIKGLPNVRFAVYFLGGSRDQYGEMLFQLPKNVVHLECVMLFEPNPEKKSPCLGASAASMDHIITLHEKLHQSQTGCLMTDLGDLVALMTDPNGVTHDDFLYNKSAWNFITKAYSRYSTDNSFFEYFWNVRNIHFPIWKLANLAKNFINVSLVHSVSTGYAGLLGALVHQHHQFPLLLTEHGIYNRERSVELMQTSMLSLPDPLLHNTKELPYQHRLWMNFFDLIARICYAEAKVIVALFENARAMQQMFGAPAQKSRVIPNGVAVERLYLLHARRPKKIPMQVAYLGRIVPIKDLKTFVYAVSAIRQEIPEIKAVIKAVGHEDPAYEAAIKELILFLDLEGTIRIDFETDMLDILAQTGLMILSSVSEGMPLVLLESLAAGVPAVVTDVGACPEIIYGHSLEDKQLGACGATVPMSNPTALAEEAVKLLKDPIRWKQAQAAGISRVDKYYKEEQMLNAYSALYRELIER